MALGVTLIISGFAFLIGAVCTATWGAAGDDQIDLYWTAGVLALLGLGSIVAVCLPKSSRWPPPLRWPMWHGAGSRPHIQGLEPTATEGSSVAPKSTSDPTVVLQELIQLAEVQLAEYWAVTRDQNTYALALSALGVAIMGVIVAAQSVLGSHWWVPLPGLGFASFVAVFGTRRAHSGLGPDPAAFYAAFGDAPTQEALSHLLADVLVAQSNVPKTLLRQRIALLGVAVLFAATAVYSTVLLV